MSSLYLAADGTFRDCDPHNVTRSGNLAGLLDDMLSVATGGALGGSGGSEKVWGGGKMAEILASGTRVTLAPTTILAAAITGNQKAADLVPTRADVVTTAKAAAIVGAAVVAAPYVANAMGDAYAWGANQLADAGLASKALDAVGNKVADQLNSQPQQPPAAPAPIKKDNSALLLAIPALLLLGVLS